MLDRDEQQCFRAAKLTNVPPEDEVVEWWDSVSRFMRNHFEVGKQDRSRLAEKLTIAHEVNRLKNLGIARAPRWIAVEDNTAGYDVLSYDLGAHDPVNRLIEVKSTIASPLRFFVSRNEWEKAASIGEAYFFYVWDMAAAPARLYVRTVKQVLPHIPIDQEKGKWSTAEIPLSAQ